MSTPRRGMQRAAVRGRARAAHQGRAAQHGHARIWSWRVWYLHICNTGEVRSLQPMPVPRGVRFATYNRCPNKHKASCEIRSAPRSRVHTCNAALRYTNHYGWHTSEPRMRNRNIKHVQRSADACEYNIYKRVRKLTHYHHGRKFQSLSDHRIHEYTCTRNLAHTAYKYNIYK